MGHRVLLKSSSNEMQAIIMKDNFDKKINEDFSSLDGMQRAEAPSWFFTKLEARMLKQANYSKGFWGNVISWLTQPAVVFAGICLIIFVNASVLFFKPVSSNDTLATLTEQNTSDEYSQVSATLFDYETIKP